MDNDLMTTCALYTSDESAQHWQLEFDRQFPHLIVQDWLDIANPEQVKYGIVWKPTQAFFERFPNLTTLFNLGAGVDAILNNAAVPKHIDIYRIEDGGMAAQMNQYFSYFLLHYFRDMDRYQQQQSLNQWQVQPFKAASSFRVGILGLGQLGSQLAQHLQSYGFDVAGWSRNKKHLNGVTSYAGPEELESFLNRTDALCCLLPLTPDTQGILNRKNLSNLPKGAVVINAGRGEHLIVHDLLQLLDENHLRGTVLDVYEQEPLHTESPLWQHPKVMMTPHSSAQSEYAPCVEKIGNTLQAITNNQTPSGLVDRSRGY
jgi:glyoxylate/hydroxypyruvate reductase A